MFGGSKIAVKFGPWKVHHLIPVEKSQLSQLPILTCPYFSYALFGHLGTKKKAPWVRVPSSKETFNFAQMLQGENVPASVAKLQEKIREYGHWDAVFGCFLGIKSSFTKQLDVTGR